MTGNMWNSSWEQLTESFKSEEGPRVPFMKLQPGKNVIRVASNPSKIYQHWEKTVDGKSKKITCIGTGCPLCAIGHVPSTRFQIKVLDKLDPNDPQPKILETGATVIKQISNYANDAEYGDPSNYDIKIQKEGTGKETRYAVTASPNKNPMSPREQALINELPDIKDINKELTREQILNLNLIAFDENQMSMPPSGNNQQFNSFNQNQQNFNNSPNFSTQDGFNQATPSQRKSQALEEWDNI